MRRTLAITRPCRGAEQGKHLHRALGAGIDLVVVRVMVAVAAAVVVAVTVVVRSWRRWWRRWIRSGLTMVATSRPYALMFAWDEHSEHRCQTHFNAILNTPPWGLRFYQLLYVLGRPSSSAAKPSASQKSYQNRAHTAAWSRPRCRPRCHRRLNHPHQKPLFYRQAHRRRRLSSTNATHQ